MTNEHIHTPVTNGLDPVVHADVPGNKQRHSAQQADASHGLPGQARQ
jgi:hypothetical protein